MRITHKLARLLNPIGVTSSQKETLSLALFVLLTPRWVLYSILALILMRTSPTRVWVWVYGVCLDEGLKGT